MKGIFILLWQLKNNTDRIIHLPAWLTLKYMETGITGIM
jgi:hypothetical protein